MRGSGQKGATTSEKDSERKGLISAVVLWVLEKAPRTVPEADILRLEIVKPMASSMNASGSRGGQVAFCDEVIQKADTSGWGKLRKSGVGFVHYYMAEGPN